MADKVAAIYQQVGHWGTYIWRRRTQPNRIETTWEEGIKSYRENECNAIVFSAVVLPMTGKGIGLIAANGGSIRGDFEGIDKSINKHDPTDGH